MARTLQAEASSFQRSDTAAGAAQCGLTLWIQRTGAAGLWCKLKGVDPDSDVYDLAERWVSVKKLDVDPSSVMLRLVAGPGDDPSKAQEHATIDPRLTLRAAGVKDGSSLLADYDAAPGAHCVRCSHRCARLSRARAGPQRVFTSLRS